MEIINHKGKYYLKTETRYREVLATTDETLYLTFNNGKTDLKFVLPQPSQQFIEKYIEEYNKGNIITDVLVEYESDFNSCFCTKDICNGNNCPKKLKINPKDNTITIKKIKDSYSREEVDRMLDEQASKTTAEMMEKFKDNTITIKKVKNNYTREELCQILEKFISFIWSEVGIHYPSSLGKDAKDKFINREL